MSAVTSLAIIDSVDIQQVSTTMQKISQFQTLVQKTLKADHDFGVIPGTQKPTLLKPGAEKILMLMGLTSEYDVTEKVQDYDRGFFAFTVKCTLTKDGYKITEGLGHANTREGRYNNRWVTESKLPDGVDKSTLKRREKESKFEKGKTYFEYQVGNDDPFTLANTVLKMAKKRAQVDAVLTVASLSEIFTQDIEDLPPETFAQQHNPAKSTAGRSTASAASASKDATYFCHGCGVKITQAVNAYSEKHFGRPLCQPCQKAAKESPPPHSGEIQFSEDEIPFD